MGANIDYAIVISSHYSDLKKEMRPKEAIIAALNEAFPTIFTSGTILAVAGALIGVPLSSLPSAPAWAAARSFPLCWLWRFCPRSCSSAIPLWSAPALM
jgi:uncharacterized membrane protein YdfJ with MMPL/SSD domain